MIDRRQLIAGSAALLLLPARARADAPVLERRSPALDRLVAPDTAVATIATGIRWAEGPVWVPRLGGLLFSDPPANTMRLWRHGHVSVFLRPSGLADPDGRVVREAGSNGLGLDRQGRLLIANSGGRSLDRVDLATRRRTVLVGRYRGKRFNSPNDLTVARDGAIYFTDPPYGLVDDDRSPAKELDVNGVYRWTQGGEAVLVDGTLTRPNGIALSPDERRLFVSVSDEAAPRIMVYDLDAEGMPTARRVWLDAKPWLPGPGLPDGMKCLRDGTMACSAPGGMYLLTPEAKVLGLVRHDAAIANCCVGGADGQTLFMTANDRVLSLPLRRDMRRG